MNYSIILAFCIVQFSLLLVVLTQKRLRNIINLLFAAIQVIILLKFIYYYFHFRGSFQNYPYLIYIIRLLQSLPPLFLWLYASAIITGSTYFRRQMLFNILPVLLGMVFFVPLVIKSISPNILASDLETYNRWFGLIVAELAGIQFLVYSYFIFRKLFRTYNIESNFLKALLDSSHPHLLMIKILSVMMNVYALILIVGGLNAFFSLNQTSLIDYLDVGFLVLLSYIMIFVLVSVPKVIHFKQSRLARPELLTKYEKSNLSKEEAASYVNEMNQWMKLEKPYLDSNLSLGDLAEKLNLPGHIVSEVLNGYLKQNFYDYVNNFRIEEFKNLAKQSENVKVASLNLAFEAGFNSKTTFNTSFKKFTGVTPSHFRSSLQ